MNGRLIAAIISNMIEEAALVAIVLVGLPEMDINIPLPGLIAMMVAWGVLSVVIYRMGSRALRRRPVTGMEAMVGIRGKVVSPLAPEGLVKIGAELWRAKSAGGSIDVGQEVTVLGSEAKRLIVAAGRDAP